MSAPVLHALRCVGAAGVPRLAEFTGLPADDVESELIDLGVAGLAGRAAGLPGAAAWQLTDAGKATDARWTAEELDAAGARAAVEGARERFDPLNAELLDLCTAWQVRSAEHHDDPAHDARVLSLLTDLDHRAADVCAALAGPLPRFGRYRDRLAGALARARSGEREFVTDSTESYHAIWAQLHEDLLATLGVSRW